MKHKYDTADINITHLAKARAKCYRLLARRAHSQQELQAKLRQAHFGQNLIDLLIGELTEQGLLDDKTFAEDLVNWRLATKLVGKTYLQQELMQKGIDKSIITPILNNYTREQELNNALTLARQKLTKPIKDNWRRVANLLYRRGFSAEIITSVYAQLGDVSQDELS